MDFALRNWLAIILGFLIGYVGHSTMLAPHDASIASTIGVLLSNFAGSAITKNLGRLQGLVLGTVSGQLIFSFFGECSTMHMMGTMACIFCFTTMGLFIYYHS